MMWNTQLMSYLRCFKMKFSKVCTILQLNREHACGVNLVLQANLWRDSLSPGIQPFTGSIGILYILYSNQQHSELSLPVICFINGCCNCAGFLFRSALHLALSLRLSLIMYLSSISSWHAEYVHLEPVSSCTFHMPPLYVMCNCDYGTQKHEHLFQLLEDSQLSLGTFSFSLSVQM